MDTSDSECASPSAPWGGTLLDNGEILKKVSDTFDMGYCISKGGEEEVRAICLAVSSAKKIT